MMTRKYRFDDLMMILTSHRWFVMKGKGERYFFAQIVD